MIRLGKPSDLEIVYKLDRDNLDSNWTKTHYENALDTQQLLLFEEADIICGFLAFQSLVDDVELLQIVFDQTYQGSGKAHDLWNYFLNSLKENNMQRVLVEVKDDNKRAIGFYLKNGFTEYGFRRNYYGVDDHAILMERRVSDDTHGI